MIDCLRRYDSDGLHFDYIRYSNQALCYCAHCQQEFARKYGFRPLQGEESRFPVLLDVGANPVDRPTTAQVLATLENGTPAVALNRLGAGQAVVLNWRAAQSASPAVDKLAGDQLARFRAGAKNTFQLSAPQPAAKYGRKDQTKANDWLRRLGFPAKIIDQDGLRQVPGDAVLVLYAQYYLAEETAGWLERFLDRPARAESFASRCGTCGGST